MSSKDKTNPFAYIFILPKHTLYLNGMLDPSEGGGGGGVSKRSKTNPNNRTSNLLSSITLYKSAVCLYTHFCLGEFDLKGVKKVRSALYYTI